MMIDWNDGSIHFVSNDENKFSPLEKYVEDQVDIKKELKNIFESAVDLNGNWANMTLADANINEGDLELTYSTMVPIDSSFRKPVVDTSKVDKDYEELIAQCYKLTVWGS